MIIQRFSQSESERKKDFSCRGYGSGITRISCRNSFFSGRENITRSWRNAGIIPSRSRPDFGIRSRAAAEDIHSHRSLAGILPFKGACQKDILSRQHSLRIIRRNPRFPSHALNTPILPPPFVMQQSSPLSQNECIAGISETTPEISLFFSWQFN